LTDVVKKSFYGKTIQSYLFENEKVSIGKIAPAFTIKDVNGNAFQLSSMQGKFVLIDFWASWCGLVVKKTLIWYRLINNSKIRTLR
jgi:thiol-disulfide isomerase/thioredoxin